MKRDKLIEFISRGSSHTNYFPKSKDEIPRMPSNDATFFFTAKTSSIYRPKQKYSNSELQPHAKLKHNPTTQMSMASNTHQSSPQLPSITHRYVHDG